MKEKESFRIDELAERWDLSSRTIYRLIERGDIRPLRIGGSIRIRKDEVQEYEHREKPGPAKKA